MNFTLSYSGQPGNISATLAENGRAIATETGLKNAKAARRWGAAEANLHKIANTVEETRSESVSVYGTQTFSL